MVKKINRRRFLHSTAAASMAAPYVLSTAFASERPVRAGLIGCGWWGMVVTKAALEAGGIEVLGVCDVDSAHLSNSAGELEELSGRRPSTFQDYRQLLDMDGLEAVIIATPPHWHALMFIDACRKGLDIYCEKPLAYDIREGQAMLAAAQEAQNVVQIGFQRRRSSAFQQVRDYIAEGRAGEIIQAEARIHYTAGVRDAAPQDPPETLDWDQWCGPAPKLPYSPNIGHFAWRLEKEYGNGHLVDWGIHLIDATRVILGESAPASVRASGGTYALKGKITTPDLLHVQFDFSRCPVIWNHRIWGAAEYRPEVSNGIFFYGEEATVFVTDDRWEVVPKDQELEIQVIEAPPPERMEVQHARAFLESVRTRRQLECDTLEGFQSTTAVQLAMISLETDSTVRWDAEKGEIKDNPAASKLLKRPYRLPWRHPYGTESGAA